MRGPLAGLGDSAAARAIHRRPRPVCACALKPTGLFKTPSRDQNPLRLRVPPRSIPLTHTQKKPSGVSTAQSRNPFTYPPGHCPVYYPGLPNAWVIRQTIHAHVRKERARAGGARPAVLPVVSPSVPPPTPLPSYWPDRGGGGGHTLPSPSLPIGQTVGRAPPSIGYGRGPLPAADSPLAEAGDRETLLGNGAGDPRSPLHPPTPGSDGAAGRRPAFP